MELWITPVNQAECKKTILHMQNYTQKHKFLLQLISHNMHALSKFIHSTQRDLDTSESGSYS